MNRVVLIIQRRWIIIIQRKKERETRFDQYWVSLQELEQQELTYFEFVFETGSSVKGKFDYHHELKQRMGDKRERERERE